MYACADLGSEELSPALEGAKARVTGNYGLSLEGSGHGVLSPQVMPLAYPYRAFSMFTTVHEHAKLIDGDRVRKVAIFLGLK